MTILSLEDYRTLTGDTATEDGQLELFLTIAQSVAEVQLGRAGLLELGTHTETLDLFDLNTVYPTAVPIDSATPGWINEASFRVPGALMPWHGLDVAWGRMLPVNVRTTVTYTGGYDQTTAPWDLRLGLAKLTQTLLGSAPSILANAPAGTKAITVGDVSITLARALGSDVLPADVEAYLCAYRAVDAAKT